MSTRAWRRAALLAVRDVARLVWGDAGRYVRLHIAAVLGLLIIGSALTALSPVALKRAVDALANVEEGASVSVLGWIGLYILSQGLARSLGQLRNLAYARAERRMFRSLSERLFGHVMRLPLRFHLDRQIGAIGQMLDNGLQGYQLLMNHLTLTIAPAAVELGTVMLVLLAMRQAGFVSLFMLAIVSYLLVFGVSAPRIARAAKTASAARVDASATMTDGILSYEMVKLFAAESAVQDRVSTALRRSEREWVAFYRRYAGNGLAAAALFVLFLAAALVRAAREVRHDRMTVGDFVLVSAYMLQVVRPVETLGYAMQGLSQGLAMLVKLLDLYREPAEGRGEADVVHAASGVRECVQECAPEPAADARCGEERPCGAERLCGELEFTHVSFAYRAERPVLTDLSFRLPAGRTLGVVGASGSGKSTLIRLLVRLLEPDSGLIRLDGVDTGEVPLAELRRMIAVVPQDTALLDGTIAGNIALGRAGCSANEVECAARLARLHEWISGLPQGYETRVGERGAKLSGGERQRVSIARAALKPARLYVLDEATSSLDSATEHEILGNFRLIAGDRSTLIIAHRLSTVVDADEILVLDGGCVAERGSHRELIALGGRYAALWRAQRRPGATAAGRAAARRC